MIKNLDDWYRVESPRLRKLCRTIICYQFKDGRDDYNEDFPHYSYKSHFMTLFTIDRYIKNDCTEFPMPKHQLAFLNLMIKNLEKDLMFELLKG